MAKPVAYFGFSKNGLEVTFINNSLNNPTSYQWDFGDSTTSILKDPTHTYTTPGYYQISLIATNADGSSDPFVWNIGVSVASDTSIAVPLIQLIDQYLPGSLVGDSSINEKANLINKWQLFLQPLVESPNPVPIEQIHNEFAWPGLSNYLIAQLCAYDIILQGANQFLSQSGSESSSSSSDSGTIDPTSRIVKSVETGPSKVEWFENRSSEELERIGNAFASATRVGGALDQLKISICQLASRLKIKLAMCPPLPKNNMGIRVFYPNSTIYYKTPE